MKRNTLHSISLTLACGLQMALTGSAGAQTTPGTIPYNYNDAMIMAYGYNATTGQRMGANPFASTTITRGDTGDGKTNFNLIEGTHSAQLQDGSALDLSVEGRYMGYSGSASVSAKNLNELYTYDYVLQMTYDIDYGNYVLSNFQLSSDAQQLANQGRVFFETMYGTYCVTGEELHSYVNVYYLVHSLTAKTKQDLNMSLNASGDWVVGSANVNSDYASVLEKIATDQQIEVRISSNVPNMPVNTIIANPGDVTTVLAQIGTIANSLSSAQPVPYKYWVSPWETLITQWNLAGNPLDPDINYQVQIQQYFADQYLNQRLLQILAGESNFYSYLSSDYITYFTSMQKTVQSQMTAIIKRLQSWVKGTTKSTYMTFTPINVNWHTPWVLTHPYSWNINQIYVDLFMVGSASFQFAVIHDPVTGYDLPLTNEGGYTNKLNGEDLVEFYYGGGNICPQVDYLNCVIQVFNAHNDLVLQVPLPDMNRG